MSEAPFLIVVAGVSGCGKSTIGAALAQRLSVDFCEGDTLHGEANIAKMAAGHPLTDEDRRPWLDRIGRWLAGRLELGRGGVVSCSALRQVYRQQLVGHTPGLAFVFCEVPKTVLERRLSRRPGHFMPAALLESQLATLEPPAFWENAFGVDATRPIGDIVEAIVGKLVSAG